MKPWSVILLVGMLLVSFLFADPVLAGGVDLVWAQNYRAPGDSADVPVAIITDAAGDVYVAMICYVNSRMRTFGLVKYNAEGDTIWTRRYFYPGGDSSDACANMTIDQAGNIILTGTSSTRGGSMERMQAQTIKYLPNGDTVWVRRYHRSNGRLVKVDPAGNILVGGNWWDNQFYNSHTLMIKYLPNGDTVWVRTYPGDAVNDFTFDADGNAHIAAKEGNSNTLRYFLVLKCQSDGDTAWYWRYRNPNDNEARAVALDGLGNVYAVGYSDNDCYTRRHDYVTAKYTSGGDQSWMQRYNPSVCNYSFSGEDVVVDAAGQIYVGGVISTSSSRTYSFVKYDSLGREVWPHGIAYLCDVYGTFKFTVTSNGDLCGIGGFHDLQRPDKFFVFSFDSSGTRLWSAVYDSSSNAAYSIKDMAIDLEGNVYVTGTDDSGHAVTVKYRPHITTIEDGPALTPKAIILSQNYPNPFNPATTIEYQLIVPSDADLSVYNILGQKIVTLVHGQQQPGHYSFDWNAQGYPSGIYFYSLTTASGTVYKRMLLLK